jgi:site-specific DNA-methyltransferase (adenine-specific)
LALSARLNLFRGWNHSEYGAPLNRVEQIGDATLYCGDCRDVLPLLAPVQAIVTSPPYDGLREYGERGSAPEACIPLLAGIVAVGGVIVWNVADQTIDGSESGTSFAQALAFKSHGLRLHDTMIYCKESVTFPDNNRYHPAFEYMFVLSNGAPRHFNGIRDWKNKWGGSIMHGTDKNPDGTTSKINGHGRPVPVYGLRRNWWVISNPFNGETDGHPAPMPYSLAFDHIATWTGDGDIVLDPYLGSGTCGVAAINLGRKFIGIEIEPKYFDIACRRIEAAYKQPRLFKD